MTLDYRIVSRSIDVPVSAAYEYAHEMRNLPAWASGLASGIAERNGRWFTDSPMGRVQVEMAPHNGYGVLDHDVTLPDGTRVHNAFRFTPAGDGGCIASFVVLRMPGTDDAAFDADCAHVARDLDALRKVLEAGHG